MMDETREGKGMPAYVHNLSSCLGECFYGVYYGMSHDEGCLVLPVRDAEGTFAM